MKPNITCIPEHTMLIITGFSGAGKSIALNVLEDMGYYCVDNLPVVLLESFICDFACTHHQPIAVAIDSRNVEGVRVLPEKILSLRRAIPLQLIFLTAEARILACRFSESRRPHPLSIDNCLTIPAAIQKESELLGELNNISDIFIDTSTYTTNDLREKLIRILNINIPAPVITLQSFGFKNGVPINADFVFDVRFLPNPHWVADIRRFSGTQKPVIAWLDAHDLPMQFATRTAEYLRYWLKQFTHNAPRAYLTICFGCTGGQHRSVYITERVATLLKPYLTSIQVEHRDMVEYQE